MTARVLIEDVVLADDALRDHPIDEVHVNLLAAVLDECPPIVVQHGSLRLVDGRHRLEAARRIGYGHVVVELVTLDDDLLEAERIRRNAAHGLPLTREERRRAVLSLLEHHPDWSDRRIARCAGTAHTTVGRLRRGCQGGATHHLGVDHRVGSDGKTYPIPGVHAAAHARVRELLIEDPARSDRSLASETGLSPSTVGRLRRRVESEGRRMARGRGAVSVVRQILARVVEALRSLLRIVAPSSHDDDRGR